MGSYARLSTKVAVHVSSATYAVGETAEREGSWCIIAHGDPARVGEEEIGRRVDECKEKLAFIPFGARGVALEHTASGDCVQSKEEALPRSYDRPRTTVRRTRSGW